VPAKANYDPMGQMEYYSIIDPSRQFGWTPSLMNYLGGGSLLDSHTPLTAARYTVNQYQDYLKYATSGASQNLIDYLYQMADKYGIDRDVAYRQIFRESGFDPNAVSGKGAVGIAQFMPDTAADYGLTDRTDPYASLDAWGRYMRDLLRMFDGDYSKALAGYNWGQGRVAKAITELGGEWLKKAPRETIEYLDYILREGETIDEFTARGGQVEDFTKQSKCDTFDFGCKFNEVLTSDATQDVGKRIGLVLAAIVILAIAIVSLR